jgi:hypothetical protein
MNVANEMLTIVSGKIDSRKMEPVKIHEKKFGGWWVTKTKEDPKEQVPPRSPIKQKSMSNLLSSSSNIAKKEQPPVPVRSHTTLSSIMPTRSNTVTIKKLPPTPPLRSNTTISIKSPATKEAEDKTIDTSELSVPLDHQPFSSRINLSRHNHRSSSLASERM